MGLKSLIVSETPKLSKNFRLWLNLGIVYVVWGSTYAGIAVAGQTFPPLGGMGLRFTTAGLLVMALLVILRKSIRVSRVELWSVTQIGVMLLVGGIGTVSVAEQYIPTSYVSLLICVTPLYMAVLRTLKGDRPSRLSLLGVVIGLVGMVILVLLGNEPVATEPDANVLFWSLAILLASFTWALGSFRSKTMTLPEDPLVLTAWEMLMGGLVLMLLSIATGERFDFANVSNESWGAMIYLILIGSIVGYTSYIWLLEHAPISLVATYSYVNPIVAVALGVIWIGEPIGLNIVVGGAVVLVGVILSVSAEKPKAPQ